ncbi:hypothetical protein CZ771_01700 [Actinomycetales bacterium JB111]|nr:hypothetical protein CZ771_01700 [Actinomycetales bacterium JB111]
MRSDSLPDDVVRLVREVAGPDATHHGIVTLGIGGRSGAGKSTLAADVVDRLADEATVPEWAGAPERAGVSEGADRPGPVLAIALEDYYCGWAGLVEGVLTVQPVLAALREGRAGSARTWDWHAGAAGEVRTTVPPRAQAPGRPGVVVVEGCGAHLLRAELDLLLWVDEPEDVRQRRAEERDGDVSSWWDGWAAQEDAAHAIVDPFAVADLVVSPG